MKIHIISLLMLTLVAGCKKEKEITQTKTNYLDVGYIEVLDEELNQLIDPTSKLEILSEGHSWTEGPLWLEEEQTITLL